MNQDIQFKKPVTDREREMYARMYTPLVHKIAIQNKNKSPLPYEDLVSFGFEGLVDAMNTYDENSGKTFLQYAAYRIFYFIMNGTNREGHIVQFSDYQQKKARKAGRPTYLYQSISCSIDADGDEHWNIPEPSINPETISVEQALNDVRAFVSARFSTRDTNIFFLTFGLGEQEDIPRVKIAKLYGISSAAITYINQRVISAIREDSVLREELEELL